jgi:hypothetical protein
MLNCFFNLRADLTEERIYLNHKSRFLGLGVYLTENAVS